METNRITPDLIEELGPKDIFVFGSNLSGKHRGGAAACAMDWGAETGVPEGCAGQTYAIPTMGEEAVETLSVEEIRPYVQNFLKYAVQRPQYKFYVTEIGCGIAGLTPKEVAPLFLPALLAENICLPKTFWTVLAPMTMDILIQIFEKWEQEKQKPSSNWIIRKFKAIWDS